MATSAFKSTTKRTPIGASTKSTTDDSSSSTSRSSAAHRRSRSLSRFSRPLSGQDIFSDEAAPRGRFVNTVRGSGFPEISLDDLATEFFDSSDDRGRSAVRNDDLVRPRDSSRTGGGGGSMRRGRSVSRQGSKGSAGEYSSGGRAVSDSNNNPRRRRSVSVVRYQISDSESDLDHSQNSSNRASVKSNVNGNSHMPVTVHRPSAPNHRPVLRRSVSQKDLKYHDDYSSQSSALTDDEGRDAHSGENGIERTIRAVYAQKKAEHPIGEDFNGGLYEAMRTELRQAVEEIRMELTQATTKKKTSSLRSDNSFQSDNSDAVQAVSTVRGNYAKKLEQSQKRKQDLLAEILLEEQHGRELSEIVKELLPDLKNSVEKPVRARKRSNERSRMSRRLTEEAERYIEDFISNVEDTDISSVDGERSDTNSSLGGIAKVETLQSPAISKPLPVEMDGVVLPWLQWETTNDASPQSCKTDKTKPKTTPRSNFWDASQESTTAKDLSCQSTSSRGSWNPGVIDGCPLNFGDDRGSKCEEPGSYRCRFLSDETSRLHFDMEEYMDRQRKEEFLFERVMQQQRISSGGLLLCNQNLL